MATFSNPQLPLTFEYPDSTPAGCSVTRTEKRSEVSYRVHLTSDCSNEIYFEVGVYHTAPVEEAIDRFMEELKQRVDDVGFSAVETADLAGHLASVLTAQFSHKTRRIFFVAHAGRVYRFICDPLSPINLEILYSLSFDKAS